MAKLPFLFAAIVVTTPSGRAQTTYHETDLHSFATVLAPNGAGPNAGVIRDPAGNLYGTTIGGGAWGRGVVFKIDTTGRQMVLHSFKGGADGARPVGGLIRDETGNLYGTTLSGGNSCDVTPDPSCGVVFKIDAAGHETIIYAFTGGTDGFTPYSGVARDSAGNLYGTTAFGGKVDYGVVFKVDPSGNETVLHSFTGGADGGSPNSGVLLNSGNLYGTTTCGGVSPCWETLTGVVYKLDSAGHETVLHSFTGGTDGGYAAAGLVSDADGNLYGTTLQGGTAGLGAIFKLNPAGQETVLFNFPGGADGFGPSGVFRDPAGNLFGTASGGNGYGLVFEVSAAGQETVLYNFTGGDDGWGPAGGLIVDPAGNLYGTAEAGGAANEGVVFALNASGETVLYTFPAKPDGAYPLGGVVLDPAGNLYGTTSYDGGTVFKVDAAGQEMVLHTLSADPTAGVILDPAGNLYGTTYYGGTANDGTVFKLTSAGGETVLHNFTAGADGANPTAGVVLDSAGDLYGTTTYGGKANKGVLFKLDKAGNETILHTFTGGTDGAYPEGSVAFDSAGNLYGTTTSGVVFKLDTAGNFTVLYTFTGGADGYDLESGVVLDSAGNLYGTAYQGGSGYCLRHHGCGVVYKLRPSGQETTLYTFTGGDDGGSPLAGLILDSAGNLYGTTQLGGTAGLGVVFEVDPLGNETVLHSFLGPPDGNEPCSGVTMDSAGNLYGTTYKGGRQTEGMVFKLSPQ